MMRIDEAVVQHLKDTVVGEIKGIESIGSSVLLYEAGLLPDDKPAGSFFMSGPTGVGKTWLVESLATFLHGECKLLRVDCGSYTGEHEVAKLVGAPPGYLGHKETPPLLCDDNINKVYRSKKSQLTVVLFDEIDKAAASLPKLLLSVLDKGALRTGDGRLVLYKDCLVFFTSNHGQSSIHKMGSVPVGYDSGSKIEVSSETATKLTKQAIVKTLPPEFINRVDNWLQFQPLTEDDVRKVLTLELGKIQSFIELKVAGVKQAVRLDVKAMEWLIARGYSKEYGARALKRLLNKEILERIAIKLASGTIPGNSVTHMFTVSGEELSMTTLSRASRSANS